MEAGKKVFLAGLILLAVGAVYFVFFRKSEEISAPAEVAGAMPVDEGTVYLDQLKDLEGNGVAMDQNKVVFLNVWATWCGPCNMEMPGIQALYDKYKDNKKIAFYIISDEDSETVNPFIARKGYKLPFYQYAEAYPPALDGNAIPRTYIIHKGKILVSETGASQWNRPEIIDLIEKSISEI